MLAYNPISVTNKWWLSPLFKGGCFAQSRARQMQLLLSCLVNIKHLAAECWPILCGGQFNKTSYDYIAYIEPLVTFEIEKVRFSTNVTQKKMRFNLFFLRQYISNLWSFLFGPLLNSETKVLEHALDVCLRLKDWHPKGEVDFGNIYFLKQSINLVFRWSLNVDLNSNDPTRHKYFLHLCLVW